MVFTKNWYTENAVNDIFLSRNILIKLVRFLYEFLNTCHYAIVVEVGCHFL